jgi:hypothetical protein
MLWNMLRTELEYALVWTGLNWICYGLDWICYGLNWNMLLEYAMEYAMDWTEYVMEYAMDWTEYAMEYAMDWTEYAMEYAMNWTEYAMEYAVKYAGMGQVCGSAVRAVLADDLQPLPEQLALQDHIFSDGVHQRLHLPVRRAVGHAV